MSDHMKEAERLMRQYTTAVLEQNYEAIALYHFTLLAHIQRGAVPDGWQDAAPKTQWAACPETGTPCSRCPTNQTQCHALAAPAEVPMPESVERAMVKVIDTSADVVCASDELNKENDANFKRLLKRSKDAQAELRATVQQYGDAREAAGYARGLAEANRYRHLRALVFSDSYAATFQSLAQYRTALILSLDDVCNLPPRGEVKP